MFFSLDKGGLRGVISTESKRSNDELNDPGKVIDTDRIMYLRQYLRAFHRAISEGYPLNGYFLWSLMDNVEWNRGCTHRFGIVYTDYTTQRRIPKASFRWYAECIRQNRVV